MDKVWYRYIGYYVEKSGKNKLMSEKERRIRKCFPDEFVKEIGNEKNKLLSTIDKISLDSTTKYAIIIVSLKELGETKQQRIDMYEKIIDVAEIFIIEHPEASTIDIHNNIIINTEDVENKTAVLKKVEELVCGKSDEFIRGNDRLIMNKKVRKIFWEWQNYFIDTSTAVKLTDVSKPTFCRFSKEFMTSSDYRELYKKEYDLYMENCEDKPIRGFGPLDDEEYTTLRYLTREIDGEWTTERVEKVCKEKLGITKFIASDYIRLKMNCCDGRGPMFVAERKYNKGPEYIEKLKNELAEIS